MIKLLDQGHRHFVLDLGFVTFMDSMGLGVIVAITKRIREHDGSLRIASVSGRILKIFDLSGMRESFEIYPSAAEATQSEPSPGSLKHWPHPSSD
ncbi:STAS domain-containing protein [Streptomyces sp. ME19-01-6]|uniref:STAS domain-containing protein n=1 Tax=Streptomyces sp. ME19-01-6 TaxID=3028686 RepID=UPI0029A128B1|nr:STAS domain-containing protein [Streptomyces sp. ME19-01-6]MDX3233625.1 STAS domain-containing protein [Streptomyces sp. ME19-01-6]